MPKQVKSKTVLLDTGFLISLYNKERTNHVAAKKYYKEFLRRGYAMSIPTIVISEYQQRASVIDIMNSGSFKTAPFNYDHALETAEIVHKLGSTSRMDAEGRAEAKDDLKIIGQASADGFDYLITDDENTMFKFCYKLHKAEMIAVRPIKLSDGYDSSMFNNGQPELLDISDIEQS